MSTTLKMVPVHPDKVSELFMKIFSPAEYKCKSYRTNRNQMLLILTGGIFAILFTAVCWALCQHMTTDHTKFFAIVAIIYCILIYGIHRIHFPPSDLKLIKEWECMKQDYFNHEAFRNAYVHMSQTNRLCPEIRKGLAPITAECKEWWRKRTGSKQRVVLQ